MRVKRIYETCSKHEIVQSIVISSKQFEFLTLLIVSLDTQWSSITAEDADSLQNAKLKAVNILLK